MSVGLIDAIETDTPDSLHARLVSGIRHIILCGDLKDGMKIPEAQLCRRFDVSRTPLREALKALATEGLVTLRPNRGAIVTPLNATLLQEVFEAKEALERFIGTHAATRATDADIEALGAVHRALQHAEARHDAAEYSALNGCFHNRLAAATQNSQVQQIYAGLQMQVRRARMLVNHDPARIAASLQEHEGIMAALRIRAPLDLADRLVRHNAETARAFLASLAAVET